MKRTAQKLLLMAVLVVMAGLVVLPLYWMSISAFKTDAEITRTTPTLWPHNWVWSNFADIWGAFARPCVNSLVVSAACTGLIVILSTLAGYALAKKRFLGRRPGLEKLLPVILVRFAAPHHLHPKLHLADGANVR